MFVLNYAGVLVVVVALLVSTNARALDLDLAVQGGLARAQDGANSYSANRLLALGGVLSVLQPVYRGFSVGAQTDYRVYSQQSAPDLAKGGDRSGTRWSPIAPFVDLHLGPLRLRFNYQFLGSYVLSSPTASGEQLSYGKPEGLRGEAHVCMIRNAERFFKIPGACRAYIGGYYQQLSFGTEAQGATTATLSERLVLREAGLTIGVGW